MTTPTDPRPTAALVNRRTMMLTTLAAVFTSASCGGGGGGNAPSSTSSVPLPDRLTLTGSVMRAPSGAEITLLGISEGTWGTMQKQDAGFIASQGATVVRVLIRWWGLYGGTDVESRDDAANGHFKADHVTEFLQNIQWCIDAGLWVIPAIDSNCGQNGLQSADMVAYCDTSRSYPDGHNFWTDLSQRQLFKEAWVYLANILKGYPNIAFYELLPEPLQNRDASYSAQVSAFYQELMAAIEDNAGDTRTPFLVGARDAYNIQLCDEAYIADPRWANRVVYTGNLFTHTGGTQAQNIADLQTRLGALSTMKVTRNVPVFIQQFGVRSGDDPGEVYLNAGLSFMNAAGIGYAGWQWRQNTTNPNEYAIVIQDPNTGADVVKTAVLAVYSKYWRS